MTEQEAWGQAYENGRAAGRAEVLRQVGKDQAKETRMVAYIAGPITGVKDYKKNFNAVAEVLKAAGYIVLNPAELPEGLRNEDYMRICHAMLDAADRIFFLPGWTDSKGACVERMLGMYIGKRMQVVQPDENGSIEGWRP